MEQPRRTEIGFSFSRGQPYQQRVSWPILQSTDKAWLIRTPAGELWVPSYRWSRMLPGVGAPANEQQFNAVLNFFRDITSMHRDARVEVRRAGKGSSDLSVTVGYTVVVCCPDSGRVINELKRTSIVPASQFRAEGDKWSVPRWVVAKKLKPGEAFETRPGWPGMQALQGQLQAAFDAAMVGEADAAAAALKAGEEAAKRRTEKDTIAADAKAHLQALVAVDGELALAFARKKLTLDELVGLGCRLYAWPRWLPGEHVDGPLEITLASIVNAVRSHPDFAAWREKNIHRRGALLKQPKAPPPRQPERVIKNCVVEWCEYIGPRKSPRRIDHRDEGCTVEIFGQKHKIELADGRFIVKMTGRNLKIIESEPARSEATA